GEGMDGKDEAEKSGNRRENRLALRLTLDLQRARAADRIVEQLERHRVVDREVVERHAFVEIGAMKVHFAAVHPNIPVALTEHQFADAASGHGATSFRRTCADVDHLLPARLGPTAAASASFAAAESAAAAPRFFRPR